MSNATQLFHSRDLIKYLPDLLDGDDPILKRPEAKEVLRNDPLAESALLAVGRAVNAYRLGRKDRLRPARKVVGSIEVARPILTAVDCLTRQLADVLGDHATYLLSKGTGDTWNSHSDKPEYAVDNYEPRLREVIELAAAHEVSIPWTRPELHGRGLATTLADSATMFRSVGQLSPHLDTELIKLNLLLIESLQGNTVKGAHWLRFADTSTSSVIRSFALHYAARNFILTGDMNSASAACIDAAVIHDPDTLELYLSLTSCAWAGDVRNATRFAASLSRNPPNDRLTDQIHGDADAWRACSNLHPAVIPQLVTVLPGDIGAAIDKAVSQ